MGALKVDRWRSGSPFAPRLGATGAAILIGAGGVVALRLTSFGAFVPFAVTALADAVVALALLWLAAAVGHRVLGLVGLNDQPAPERLLFGVGLGLGALGLIVMALGFAGHLHRIAVGLVVVGLAVVCRDALRAVGQDLRQTLPRLWAGRPTGPTVPLLALIATLVLALTLVPPVTWDGLAYHLAAPQAWLQAGALTTQLDNPPANYPSLAQLTYAMLMLTGSDTGPQVLHALLAGLCVVLVGRIGFRLGGARAGWLAAVAMISSPAVTFFAWHANIDFAWTLAETLGLYALLLALVPHTVTHGPPVSPAAARRWLLVAGTCYGLAASMKYLSVASLAAAVGMVGVVALVRQRDLRRALGDGVALLAPALLIAAPWYLRNAVVLGNPVWPTYWGGAGWSAARATNFAEYVARIGHDTSWPAVLLLPLRLFLGDHEQPLAIPSLLFLLLPLVLAPPRSRLRLGLVAVAAGQFALWALGMTEIRFLFPAFPALALSVGLLLADPPWLLRGPIGGLLIRWLPPLALVVALVPLLVFVPHVQPWRPLLGFESRDGFVGRLVASYPATRLLNDTAPLGSRVLLIGDGRTYYHRHPVRSDVFRDALAELEAAGDEPRAWATWLAAGGYTHVLVSDTDLAFSANYLPPSTYARRLDLLRRLQAANLAPLFNERSVRAYAVTPVAS